MFAYLLDWIFHLDVHLVALSGDYGAWVYAILFLVILVETGVVVMPFLPGDSLLFVAGALAAAGALDPWLLAGALSVAAIAGDTLNFAVGSYVRRHAVDTRRWRFLKMEHVERTHAFFERHGGKTIILARFVPIVRTLAPFVAALGDMPYRTFLTFNVVGGLAWVGLLIFAGYAFGNVALVRDHLNAVLLGIVALSMVPAVLGWLRETRLAPGKH
ncbi:MAG: VTT domain-containing protein [Pseudomonadota bacterium]